MADLVTFTCANHETDELYRWTIRGKDIGDLLEVHAGLVMVNRQNIVIATTEQIVAASLSGRLHVELKPSAEQIVAAIEQIKKLSVQADQRAALQPPTRLEQMLDGYREGEH